MGAVTKQFMSNGRKTRSASVNTESQGHWVSRRLELRRWDRVLQFSAGVSDSKIKLESMLISTDTAFSEEGGGFSALRSMGFIRNVFPGVGFKSVLTSRRGKQATRFRLRARCFGYKAITSFESLISLWIPVAHARRTLFSIGGGHGFLSFVLSNLGELSFPLDPDLNYLGWDGKVELVFKFSASNMFPPYIVFSTIF